MRFERMPTVTDRTGKKKSTIHLDIRKGLFPAPVKIGPRASAWPAHETDQILAARLAGQTDDQIRALVSRIHEARKHATD